MAAARATKRLIERLGGFPATRAPLNAEVLETKDFGSYTREKIVFDTRKNLSTIGYLLLPKDAPRPLPAVVCVSGHGRGLPDILGIADDGSPARRAQRRLREGVRAAVRGARVRDARGGAARVRHPPRRRGAPRRAGRWSRAVRPRAPRC